MKIFFSTTFGGETLSLAAALTTIKYLQKEDVINKIKKFSNKLIRDIKKIIYKLNLNKTFVIEGVCWRPAFGVCKGVNRLYLEVLRKNLIKNKLLIGNSFNFCYAHTNINIYKQIITRIETSLRQTSNTKLGINNYVKKNSVRS